MIEQSEPAQGGVTSARVVSAATAVLCVDVDEQGEESLGVWHIDRDDGPVGAWIFPSAGRIAGHDQPDAMSAHQILSLVRSYPMTAYDRDSAEAKLTELSHAAGSKDAKWWQPRWVDPGAVVTDILERRRDIADAVAATRTSGSDSSALEWRPDLDDSADLASIAGLATYAGIGGDPAPSSVARAALTTGRVLRWLVEQWNEVEQVKTRRRAVGERLGKPEPLPPSWQRAAEHAAGRR